MLKIWGRKNSSNVRKPLWAAEELGLAYEAIDAGGAFGVVDTPEYRAMNPNGRVPVIEDDGFVLWESNAIVRYLLAKHAPSSNGIRQTCKPAPSPTNGWTGPPPVLPVRSARCSGVCCARQQTSRTGRDQRRNQEMRSAAGHGRSGPASEPYLSGENRHGRYSLGSFIYAWFEMPIERARMPHLEAWYARLKQRPAYQKAVMTALT
jgi:glutathione S-transferase